MEWDVVSRLIPSWRISLLTFKVENGSKKKEKNMDIETLLLTFLLSSVSLDTILADRWKSLSHDKIELHESIELTRLRFIDSKLMF